ncbi:MAG: COG3650 family protein [Steroidobacter sp.]
MRSSRELFVIIGAAALVSVGCSRREPSPPADATSSAPEADIASAAASPSEAPAESGLAIKRGVVMLAQDRTTFRPCEENTELWLLDQTDGVLTRTFAGEAANAPTMLYIEAYGERGPTGEDVPEARAYAGVFVLEEVLYAALQDSVKGCAAPEPDYIVAARGTEPFWSMEIRETQMLWRRPDEAREIVLNSPQPQDAEGAVRYLASSAGHEADVLIDARVCRDAMSGEFFAYSAKAVLDGAAFSGCARVGN